MKERTPAQIEALAMARLKRKIARERTVPDGYRSIKHLLNCARNTTLATPRGMKDLIGYLRATTGLRANSRNVRKWFAHQRTPIQSTIDALARWMEGKA